MLSHYIHQRQCAGNIVLVVFPRVELQNAGYDVVVVDNLANSSEKSLERVEKITGKPVKFYKADILDRDALEL